MSEQTYIRARDLQKGDVLAKHGIVFVVSSGSAGITISAQRSDGNGVTVTIMSFKPEDWVEIRMEPDS